MAVEAGLADQDLDAPAEAVRHGFDPRAHLRKTRGVAARGGTAHAGRRAVFTKHVAQGQIGRATSELQSLMRSSYAVFCLKTKKTQNTTHTNNSTITSTD